MNLNPLEHLEARIPAGVASVENGIRKEYVISCDDTYVEILRVRDVPQADDDRAS